MIDPISEAEYRLRLANEHLGRAEAYYDHGDWAGCVRYSQLAIENFAKAIISVFEVPTWSHDPSNQLMNVMNKVPEGLRGLVGELARLSHEVAREYARSTYGEPSSLLTPGMLYDRDYAGSILNSARRARDIAYSVLRQLGVDI